MTEPTPEPAEPDARQLHAPAAVEERTGVDEQGEQFVPAPSGEQGDGELEVSDDLGPDGMAGRDVSEFELEAEQGNG
jgi:hypothetical protein